MKKQSSDSNLYTVRQAAVKLGVPKSKIRYYATCGLIPNLKHSRSGYRLFSDDQIDWLMTLFKLANAGFSIRDLKKYAALHFSASDTIPDQKAMLATQKCQLWQQLEQIQDSIDFIERQIEYLEQESS